MIRFVIPVVALGNAQYVNLMLAPILQTVHAKAVITPQVMNVCHVISHCVQNVTNQEFVLLVAKMQKTLQSVSVHQVTMSTMANAVNVTPSVIHVID